MNSVVLSISLCLLLSLAFPPPLSLFSCDTLLEMLKVAEFEVTNSTSPESTPGLREASSSRSRNSEQLLCLTLAQGVEWKDPGV